MPARRRRPLLLRHGSSSPRADHAYCDRRGLGIRERLDLFSKSVMGPPRPWEGAVLHRDLKPSNILSSRRLRRAAPEDHRLRLAKALNEPLTEESIRTGAGQLMGTPEYMSPEQAEMADGDLDGRRTSTPSGHPLRAPDRDAPDPERDLGGQELLRASTDHREVEPRRPASRIARLEKGRGRGAAGPGSLEAGTSGTTSTGSS